MKEWGLAIFVYSSLFHHGEFDIFENEIRSWIKLGQDKWKKY